MLLADWQKGKPAQGGTALEPKYISEASFVPGERRTPNILKDDSMDFPMKWHPGRALDSEIPPVATQPLLGIAAINISDVKTFLTQPCMSIGLAGPDLSCGKAATQKQIRASALVSGALQSAWSFGGACSNPHRGSPTAWDPSPTLPASTKSATRNLFSTSVFLPSRSY